MNTPTLKTLSAVLMSFVAFGTYAQKSAPENWFHLDQQETKYPGISTQKAYDFLKGKTAREVVVAVIDGGTDVNHEDLKPHIWINSNEIPDNGIDDDHNGYIDDMHGWNFIGGKDSNVNEDSYEVTRVYAMFKDKFKEADSNKMSAEERANYRMFLAAKKEYRMKYSESTRMTDLVGGMVKVLNEMKANMKSDNPTLDQVKAYEPDGPVETQYKKYLVKQLSAGMDFNSLLNAISGSVSYYEKGSKYGYNTEFNPRTIVGDNYEDAKQCCYGNNKVTEPNGEHGTHVAGIIAALRGNQIGMDGIATEVRIMVLRAVPDGDERDKDVANAIRYAADNGAKIINMSFGKNFSPYKSAVDDAIRYAESKDVLIVHAAGNDGKNTEEDNNFPRDRYNNNTYAANWIEVGASSWSPKRKKLPADFSNYGPVNVDIFAPGVDIYSTLPGNKYASYNGTSMASPVTAGVAALIRAYYPSLTAIQVKRAILEGSIQVKGKVFVPGTKKKKAKMTELCTTGARLSAYEAVKRADAIANGK